MTRKAYLDVAKFYGMALVFYGHMWAAADELPTDAIVTQNAFIYAFHMPLFFALSGATAKTVLPTFVALLRKGVMTRLLPALFFSLLMLLLNSALALLRRGTLPAEDLQSFLRIFSGHPYSTITWFLVCLMMVEIYDHLIRSVASTAARAMLVATAVLALALVILENIGPIERFTGVPKNFWYVHEALVAVFFYELGFFAKQKGLLDRLEHLPWHAKLGVLLASLLVTGLFLFNDGGTDRTLKVVLMVTSQHGSPIWFVIPAIAGSLFILVLSMLTPPHRAVIYIGTNTLALLGVN